MKIYVSNDTTPPPTIVRDLIATLADNGFEVTYWEGGDRKPPSAAERFRFIAAADVMVVPYGYTQAAKSDAAIAAGAEKPVIVLMEDAIDEGSIYSLSNTMVVKTVEDIVDRVNAWRLSTESFGALRMMQIFAASKDVAWVVRATDALYGRIKSANKPYDYALLFKGTFLPLDERNRVHPAHVIQFCDQAETLAIIGTSPKAVLGRLESHLDAVRRANEEILQKIAADAPKPADPPGNSRTSLAAS